MHSKPVQPTPPEELVRNKPAHEALQILERQIERWLTKAADIAGQDHPNQARVEAVREHLKALELEASEQRRRLAEMN